MMMMDNNKPNESQSQGMISQVCVESQWQQQQVSQLSCEGEGFPADVNGRQSQSRVPVCRYDVHTPEEVIRRIELVVMLVTKALDRNIPPQLETLSNRMVAVVAEDDGSTDERPQDDNGGSDRDDDDDDDTSPMNANNFRLKSLVLHNMSQCRNFTSILMIYSFCHALLLANRTTTTREVYYFYVTHFRSQRECDSAIADAANMIRVPRKSLGLYASPKGWFSGCLQIIRHGHVVLDGRTLTSIQGAPITSEWLTPQSHRDFTIQCRAGVARELSEKKSGSWRREARDEDEDFLSDSRDCATNGYHDVGYTRSPDQRAKCILVIEKEGVYNRLSEDRLFERYPCILVTGKGFPDLATRSLVHSLHSELGLPVYGIADCNPSGVMVLQTYQYGSERMGVDGGDRYSVPIQWLGLRPSHVQHLGGFCHNDENGSDNGGNDTSSAVLPADVYQEMTELDQKRLNNLLDETHRFHGQGRDHERIMELELMKKHGFKVELEALNWLGMEYLASWVHQELLQLQDERPRESDSEPEYDQSFEKELD